MGFWFCFFFLNAWSAFLSQNFSFLFSWIMVLTSMVSTVTGTSLHQSVVDESDQSWPRLPLTVHQIIWLTVLPHNPHLRDQWQFLRGDVKHSNFLPTVASSPFFCLSSLLPAIVHISRYLASFSKMWKVSPKVLGEVEPRPPARRKAVLSIPLPFSFPGSSVLPPMPAMDKEVRSLFCYHHIAPIILHHVTISYFRRYACESKDAGRDGMEYETNGSSGHLCKTPEPGVRSSGHRRFSIKPKIENSSPRLPLPMKDRSL